MTNPDSLVLLVVGRVVINEFSSVICQAWDDSNSDMLVVENRGTGEGRRKSLQWNGINKNQPQPTMQPLKRVG